MPTPRTSQRSRAPTSAPSIKVLTEIPSSAFLQTADTNGAEQPTDRPSDDMLPQLCGAQYASDSLVLARKTMHITYWARTPQPGTLPDGTFDETITTYVEDGAPQFVQQLRDAVTACPSELRGGITYRNRILAGRLAATSRWGR